ncbi:MAG TPA: hypothetical protein VF311_06420 [Terriglobales bacterium]
MPYKDSERKRQWEQEHREQRNAQRRSHEDLSVRVARIVQKATPVPKTTDKPQSGWKVLIGFAVGLGVVLLMATAGVNMPPPGE